MEDVDPVDALILRSTELRRRSAQLRTQLARLKANSAELINAAAEAHATAASHLAVLTSALFAPDSQELPLSAERVNLKQPFDGTSLKLLRATVAAHAAAAGMPHERALDVMAAVHELAANAVRYGGGNGRLHMIATGAALICRVSDPGPASHSSLAAGQQPGRQHIGITAPMPLWPVRHGHGLWLIRQLADQVSVRTGPAGSRVTLTFALARIAPVSLA